MASADQFVHGWDLAKATGQATDLDPELAAELLGFYRQAIADGMRGPDPQAPFGPLVTTASADPVAQLVAFSGRTPQQSGCTGVEHEDAPGASRRRDPVLVNLRSLSQSAGVVRPLLAATRPVSPALSDPNRAGATYCRKCPTPWDTGAGHLRSAV